MIAHIIGRRSRGFSDVTRETATLGEALLETRDLSGEQKPRGVNSRFTAARSWASRACSAAGARRWPGCSAASSRSSRGEIRIKGKPVAIAKPRDAIDAGIALVPEDRARQGFVAFHSVESNIGLPNLDRLSKNTWVDRAKAAALAESSIKRLRIKTDSRKAAVQDAVGRQCPEGRHRQMARHRARRADPRRADGRHRHRLQERDRHADPRPRQVRQGDPGAVVGAAGAARRLRPHPRHVGRAHRARHRAPRPRRSRQSRTRSTRSSTPKASSTKPCRKPGEGPSDDRLRACRPARRRPRSPTGATTSSTSASSRSSSSSPRRSGSGASSTPTTSSTSSARPPSSRSCRWR